MGPVELKHLAEETQFIKDQRAQRRITEGAGRPQQRITQRAEASRREEGIQQEEENRP